MLPPLGGRPPPPAAAAAGRASWSPPQAVAAAFATPSSAPCHVRASPRLVGRGGDPISISQWPTGPVARARGSRLPPAGRPASTAAAVASGFFAGCVAAAAAASPRAGRRQRARPAFPGRRRGPESVVAVAAGSNGAGDADDDADTFSLIDQLIKQSRNAVEPGIWTGDWHEELYSEVPEGFSTALEKGVDFVDVLAGGDALNLLRTAEKAVPPRYCLRVAPRSTFGLGLVLNKSMVQSWSVLGPLHQSLKKLGVEEVDTLALHSDGGGSFPFWAYDAIAEAYKEGLCTRVGLSQPSATPASLKRSCEEFQRRGMMLSSVFVELSLLDRSAMPLVEECRSLGIHVFASKTLGKDELASGRYTAANPTGGEISVPRFTLAQLMPLRPLHQALESVAAQARQRSEGQHLIDTTQVAIQWVVSKGASPLCDVSTEETAKAVGGCTDWALTEAEILQLDKAAEEVEKARWRG